MACSPDFVPGPQEVPLWEMASAGRAGPHAHHVVPVGILLMRAAQQGGAAGRSIAHISAVAAEALQVLRNLLTLGRVIQTSHGPDLPAHRCQHTHNIPASAADLLQDFLLNKRPHCGPLRILSNYDSIQVENAGSYYGFLHCHQNGMSSSSSIWELDSDSCTASSYGNLSSMVFFTEFPSNSKSLVSSSCKTDS